MIGRRQIPRTATLVAVGILLMALAGWSDAAAPDPEFKLGHAEPNPFNPVTTIHFTLAQPAQVTLRIHDLHGGLIEEILNDFYPSGAHHAQWHGDHQNSGVYFVRMVVNGKSQVLRVTLLK